MHYELTQEVKERLECLNQEVRTLKIRKYEIKKQLAATKQEFEALIVLYTPKGGSIIRFYGPDNALHVDPPCQMDM